MLQNVDTHTKCYCYKSGGGAMIELREFEREETAAADISAQEIVFLPVGTRLSYRVSAGGAMLIFRLLERVPECHVFNVGKLSAPVEWKHDGLYALKANDRVRHFIDGLLDTQRDGLKCRLYMQAKVGELLFLLHAYYPQPEYIRFFSPVVSPDVEFSEFVRLNHTKYKNVADLAAAMSMSRQGFTDRFRRVFGTSPHKWMRQERAQAIYRDICRSGKPLKEISYEYAFPAQSHFFRFCRQAFGESPGAIRKKLKNANRERSV